MSVMYGGLAQFYEYGVRDISYERIASFLVKWFRRSPVFRASDAPLVLDIGCGTGSLTRVLAEKGCNMIGLDLSEEMLAGARQEAPEILWIHQDMCGMDLYGTVSAMVCATDGINHLLSLPRMQKFFRKIYNYLDFGGIFVFDVLTERYFRDIVGNNAYCDDTEEFSCYWTSRYNIHKKRCTYEITCYKPVSDDLYIRSDDCISEQVWSEEELEQAIAQAGLAVVAVRNGYSQRRRTGLEERLVYICQKPEKE